MKYLYLYENYNLTDKSGKKLSKKEFENLKNKHCKYYSINKDVKMYRSIIKKYDYLYQNPKGHIRHSIENENIHVILMSSMKSWKDFPKYNQSIIGSINDSEYYGEYIYEFIPFDNNNIGICPKPTIWESLGGFGGDANIKLINSFLKKVINYSDTDNWSDIRRKIMKANIREPLLKSKPDDRTFLFKNMLLRLTQFFNIKPHDITNYLLIKYIEELFDPKINNFNHFKYDENFSKKVKEKYIIGESTNDISYETYQFWTDGPVLLKFKKNYI